MAIDLSPLTAIAPIDGRYGSKTAELRPIFSEYGLMRFRVLVEIRWLQGLAEQADIPEVPAFSDEANHFLNAIIDDFSVEDALQIKSIDQRVKHDVKSIEYFLKDKITGNSELKPIAEFIHFACTSEDINNISHALMLKEAHHNFILPILAKLISTMEAMTEEYADQTMVSRTHGQIASPTTMGKEIGIFVYRLRTQYEQLINIEFLGKMNGAVGNFNAHIAAYPNIDWQSFSKGIVGSLELQYSPHTTQIESHDYIAQYFHILCRANTILIDFCRDIWGYISLGYFKQKAVQDEVGSSTMPHKINPINFENAEGNLGISNALLQHLAEKLPISRWQRDLTDSTVMRNNGLAVAHALLAYKACLAGLARLEIDTEIMDTELNNSWEILAEPLQTIMRRYGIEQPYEKLKEFTRGQSINKEKLHNFVNGLDIPETEKQRFIAMEPANYIGNSIEQANAVVADKIQQHNIEKANDSNTGNVNKDKTNEQIDLKADDSSYSIKETDASSQNIEDRTKIKNIKDHILGKSKEDIRIDTRIDNSQIAVSMIKQSRYSLEIASRKLDPYVLNTTELAEAIKYLAIRNSRSKIRIIVFEPEIIVKYDHRLLELASTFGSHIEIRKANQMFSNYNEFMLIADKTAYIYRENGETFDGMANFYDIKKAGVLLKRFDEMWEHSTQDSNLRKMHL